MKKGTIGILMLGGAAALYFFNRQRQSAQIPSYYNPNNVPPQPQQPSNAPAWQQWAAGIIAIYGAVAWLWAPGGPFYQVPTSDVYNAVPNPGGNYQWDDPNSLPGGWV